MREKLSIPNFYSRGTSRATAQPGRWYIVRAERQPERVTERTAGYRTTEKGLNEKLSGEKVFQQFFTHNFVMALNVGEKRCQSTYLQWSMRGYC